MAKVQTALMDDAMQRKWFAGKPGTVQRAVGVRSAIVLLVLGVGAHRPPRRHDPRRARRGSRSIVAGLVLLVGARWMPRRTAKGYAVLRHADGFRRFIDESEKDRARFAERKNLFSEYLPYAVVFGATEEVGERVRRPRRRAARHVVVVRRRSTRSTTSRSPSAIDSFSVSSAGTLTSRAVDVRVQRVLQRWRVLRRWWRRGRRRRVVVTEPTEATESNRGRGTGPARRRARGRDRGRHRARAVRRDAALRHDGADVVRIDRVRARPAGWRDRSV